MGLSIAPSEMQHFASATVKLVEANFPGIKGIAFLDDFLFVARQPNELIGVADYFSQAGIKGSIRVFFFQNVGVVQWKV